MSWLQAYVLFMLATAITAHYELISPVMFKLEIIDETNTLIQHKYLGHITFFLMSLLFAPGVFLMCIIPSWAETFRDSMLESLIRD